MTFLGVDPDLHTPAMAWVDDAGAVMGLSLPIKVRGCVTGTNALSELATKAPLFQSNHEDFQIAAVEAQSSQQGKYSGVNQQSLLYLAVAAGIMAGRICAKEIIFPLPQEWKGSIPKEIHQARILTKLGWKYEMKKEQGYCFPSDPPAEFQHFNTGDWEHLVDAIGLALYARQVWKVRQL